MATKESNQARWLHEYRRCMDIARKFHDGVERHRELLAMVISDSFPGDEGRDYIRYNAIYSADMSAHYYLIARMIRDKHL